MKTGKRIVSKAEYARIQSLRLGMNVSSYCLLFLTLGCVAATCLPAMMIIQATYLGFLGTRSFVMLFAGMLFAGSATFLCGKLLGACCTKIEALEKVMPFTRATIAELPAPDSLVRASQEPVQEQQSILLRAAAEVGQTPAEQLLRPTE